MTDEKNPFEGIEWPEPTIIENARTRTKLVLEAVEVNKRGEEKGWIKRTRFVKSLMERAASEFIPRAEEVIRAPGPEKKRLVKQELMRLLRAIEGRVDVVPALLEPLVFKTIEYSLGRIIESVFRELDKRGVVNSA